MEAGERHNILEALRKAKYMKSRERRKRSQLTNQERCDVIDGYMALKKFGVIGVDQRRMDSRKEVYKKK